jgi:hypothetical protein
MGVKLCPFFFGIEMYYSKTQPRYLNEPDPENRKKGRTDFLVNFVGFPGPAPDPNVTLGSTGQFTSVFGVFSSSDWLII